MANNTRSVGGLKGIEKESLRIGKDGLIAQTISIDQCCSYEYSYAKFFVLL